MCLIQIKKASGAGQAYKVVLTSQENLLVTVWSHPTVEGGRKQHVFDKESWNLAEANIVYSFDVGPPVNGVYGGAETYVSGFHFFSNLEDAQFYKDNLEDWVGSRNFEVEAQVWEIEYQEQSFVGCERICHEQNHKDLIAMVANKIKFIRKVA